MTSDDVQLTATGSAWSKFTGPHLWAAAQFAREAHRLEQEGLALAHPPDNHPIVQHYVIATILLSAAAMEAFPGEVVAPLDGPGRDPSGIVQGSLQKVLDGSRIQPKYEALAKAVGAPTLNTFMAAEIAELDALRRLRNKLVHFSPELPGRRVDHAEIEELLSTRITPSPLHPGAQLFPDGFGSYSCAKWCVTTARSVIEAFAAKIGAPTAFLTKEAHAARMALP